MYSAIASNSRHRGTDLSVHRPTAFKAISPAEEQVMRAETRAAVIDLRGAMLPA